jgi:hypothetical protein
VQLAVSPTIVIEASTRSGHVQYSSIPSGRIVVKRVTCHRQSRWYRVFRRYCRETLATSGW